MSTARNGPGKGAKPRRDVLASLKMASMEEISRASLPAGKVLERTKVALTYLTGNRNNVCYS
jgi:hypothetical protein